MSGSAGAYYEDETIRLSYQSSLIISVALPPDNTDPNYIADYFAHESLPFETKLAKIRPALVQFKSSYLKATGPGELSLVPLEEAKDFIYGTIIEDTGLAQTKHELDHGKNYIVNSQHAVFLNESVELEEMCNLDYTIAVRKQVNRSALDAFSMGLKKIFTE